MSCLMKPLPTISAQTILQDMTTSQAQLQFLRKARVCCHQTSSEPPSDGCFLKNISHLTAYWCHLGQQLPASKKTSPQFNFLAKFHTMSTLFHDFLNQIKQFSDWTLSLGLRQFRLGHLDWRNPCYHSSELARNHSNLISAPSYCVWKLVSTTSWCF